MPLLPISEVRWFGLRRTRSKPDDPNEELMKLLASALLIAVSIVSATPLHAQFAVFDAANYANALNEYAELEQLYTAAAETRDQVIEAYNLAHAMSLMPQDLYRRYHAQFAAWTNLNAPDAYGNTAPWMAALNYGGVSQSSAAYSAAVVPLSPYPQSALSGLDPATQSMIKDQYATSELTEGVTTGTLAMLGDVRSHSESLAEQIGNLESDSYSDDPLEQSEMSVLGKINAANVLELRSGQDANQLLSAAVEAQLLSQKQAVDAQNRTLDQAILFQQNFAAGMQRVLGGASQSIASVSFSTAGR
jgi:hypothetical protein